MPNTAADSPGQTSSAEIATILFVCEGNVCRSPLAAGLLLRALVESDLRGLRIDSAGTRARVGSPMDEVTTALATSFGVDPTGHRARNVTTAMLSQAALVLTSTRAQRSTVVTMFPRAVRKTLTVRQLGRLLDQPGPAVAPVANSSASNRIDLLLSDIVRRRGRQRRTDPAADDVVDPYQQLAHVHELAARQMLPALSHLSRALGAGMIEVPHWPEVG